MATLVDGGFPTLAHWAHMIDPQGNVARVTNLLTQELPILEHMPWKEGNLPTGHRITVTSEIGLPSGTWRKINEGISPTNVDTDQFDETCGMLEDESVVDVDLAQLNGDAAAFRRNRDDLKLEGLAQQVARSIFYESVMTNPERIHGLAPRYPSRSGYTSSGNVLRGGDAAEAGGSADNRSIWLVTWNPEKIYGIFPKGSNVGLQVMPVGGGEAQRIPSPNDATKTLMAFVTRFKWKLGIAVEDYRYAVRLQWDPSDSTTFSATSKALVLSVQDMLSVIRKNDGNTHMYMDRTSKKRIDRELAANGESSLLSYLAEGGKRIERFMGIPIDICDALVAETPIT